MACFNGLYAAHDYIINKILVHKFILTLMKNKEYARQQG